MDDDGLIRSPVGLSRIDDGDYRFGIAAFHPRIGTAYAEVTLHDLMSGKVTELELERGEAVVGRVLDEAGNPVASACIMLSTIRHRDGITQEGLDVLTDSDGSFYLPGIRFENKMNTIYAWYQEAAPGYERLQHSRSVPQVSQYGRIGASKIAYDPSTATWDAGDIVISPPTRGSSFKPRSRTR